MESIEELRTRPSYKLFSWDDMPPPTGVPYYNYGKSFTKIDQGRLYYEVAEKIIANNYADLTSLIHVFDISVTESDEGGVSYNAGRPNDFVLPKIYRALNSNTHITTINFDHFKHTRNSLDALLSVIAESKNLPLTKLSLKSIVSKPSRSRHSPPVEYWMVELLSKYLSQIIDNHLMLTTLSLPRNRLGFSEDLDTHLPIIAKAIASSKSLRTVDLSNNKFSFPHAMMILDLLKDNTTITSLKLTCRSMRRKEKKELELRLSAFLEKNIAIHRALLNAIVGVDFDAVKNLLSDTKGSFYVSVNSKTLKFTDDLINKTTKAITRLETKLDSNWRIKSKDIKRKAALDEHRTKREKLSEIRQFIQSVLIDKKRFIANQSGANNNSIDDNDFIHDDRDSFELPH